MEKKSWKELVVITSEGRRRQLHAANSLSMARAPSREKESEPQDKGVSEKSLGPMRKGSFPLWDQVLRALEEQI